MEGWKGGGKTGREQLRGAEGERKKFTVRLKREKKKRRRISSLFQEVAVFQCRGGGVHVHTLCIGGSFKGQADKSTICLR